MRDALASLARQPHAVFLVLAMLFGAFFALATPPFRAWDERDHFYQIYRYAQGVWVGQATQPLQLYDTVQEWRIKIKSRHKPYTQDEIERWMRTPLAVEPDVGVELTRSLMYAPTAYLPALPMTWLARACGLSPLSHLWMMRLSLMAGAVWLIYLSIRITPLCRWPMMLVALMPGSVFIRSSVSADPMTIGYVFMYFALLFRTWHDAAPPSGRRLALLAVFGVLVALSKNAYVVVAGLLLLIPCRSYPSVRRYAAVWSLVGLIPTVICMVWVMAVQPVLDATELWWPEGVDKYGQVDYLLAHPLSLFPTLLATVQQHGSLLADQLVSTSGIRDFWPPMLSVLALLALLLPFSAADEAASVSFRLRLVAAGVFMAATLIIVLMDYISWTPPGKSLVDGLQGRYFTPVLPALCVLFSLPYRSQRALFLSVGCALALWLWLLMRNIRLMVAYDYGVSLW